MIKDWISSGNKNYVRYTNLSSGNYTFLVKSSNYDGVWNETPASFNFSILKPWAFKILDVFCLFYFKYYRGVNSVLLFKMALENETRPKARKRRI